MGRESKEYQDFLDELFLTCAKQSKQFRDSLLASKNEILRHSIGKSNIKDTVLTEDEFINRLLMIRKLLQKNKL